MNQLDRLKELLKQARINNDPAILSAFEIARLKPEMIDNLEKIASSYIEDPDQEPIPGRSLRGA